MLSRRGSARDLVIAAFDGVVDLVLSDDVVTEVRRNLARKRSRSDPLLTSFLGLGVFRVVNPPLPLVEEVAQAVFPKDAPMVAGAVFARTPVLVTYDRKHLLSQADPIRIRYGIEVMAPIDLLGALGRI